MSKKEIKVAYRVVAIAGTVLVVVVIAAYIFLRLNSPYLFRFSDDIAEIRVKIKRADLPGLKFFGGLQGCENMLLDDNSMRVWVTDLTGNLTELNESIEGDLSISRQVKLGKIVTGITMGPDSTLLVGVSDTTEEGWMKIGGRIVLIDTLFENITSITGNYPSLNGMSMSQKWELLLFASSNFNPFNPAGYVYMTGEVGGIWDDPSVAVIDFGLANGVWYDKYFDRFLFSNTVEGVFELKKSDDEPRPVYYKTSFLEITDDLCSDREGNIWMTDPGNSTVKVFFKATNKLVRFSIEGIGQTSSCRIRMENGKPVLYLTELKKKHNLRSMEYDGRGVYSVPVKELLDHLVGN
jgi:hypothetical protein